MKQERNLISGPPGKIFQGQASMKNSSRVLGFAKKLAGKPRCAQVTNTRAFLDHIRRRFAGSELSGFRGSLVHKGLGRSRHQSFHTWFVESALSLTINKLEQCFGIWLNQARTQLTLSSVENKINFVLRPHAQPAQMTNLPPRSYEVLRIVKSITQTASAREMRGPVALLKAPDVLHTIEKSLAVIYANRPDRLRKQDFYLPSFQTIQPLLTVYAAMRADEIRRAFGTPVVNLPASRSRVFVALQQNAASKYADSPQPRSRLWKEYERRTQASYQTISLYDRHTKMPNGLADSPKNLTFYSESWCAVHLELKVLAFSMRDMAEKIEAMYLANPLVGPAATSRMTYVYEADGGGYYRFPKAEVVSRSHGRRSDAGMRTPTALQHLKSASGRTRPDQAAVSRWPVAVTKIENWFEQKRQTHLSFIGVKTSSARPASSVLLKAGRSAESRDIIENIFAPLLNWQLAARTVKAYAPFAEDQQDGIFSELTFVRREEQMRPPMQAYAFAQPARSTLVEEQVIKHEQEKEVVKIVRKEMETWMKARSPLTELSRFDYSQITDRVWFSLSRRLMMEKERLGPR